MFTTKAAKGPPTVITLESSPETPDSIVETGSQPSTAVVPVDGHNSGIPANPNENILPDIDSSLESASILPQLSPPETLCIPSAANQDAAAPILSERVEGMTPSKPIVIDIDSSPIKPAASRPQGGSSGGPTLAEKWRPRCAEEVLGNEASATYLRNWLRALELQLETAAPPVRPPATSQRRNKDNRAVPNRTRKRPRVITEVVRPRYRKRAKTESDDEDDWIVNDQDQDEDNAYASSYYTSDYEAELPSSPIPSTSSIPDTGSEITTPNPLEDIPPDLGELHNTILLVGPPGSGKTASVYACAEELGWEVFEVFPGIGKRSGTSIENLVGEVGKNHLVRQRPHGRHDFFTFGSPSKPKRKQGLDGLLKSEPFEHDQSSASLTEPGIQEIAADQAPSFVQSLILLEEVDILFKEDVRFWETVINLIRECKRPIICTCNGQRRNLAIGANFVF
ncbi:hypothetical protein EST38_g622 [Candolleomyces aberdarensis]|uniref:ATPase AAA-type core domain-containing protein n=1 Tax=Candolleomyces aberdarensis TaxID=2316362 RepID=A0A4Q2DZ63_9AGAR|nr:hypothetical protein EST38_g622 [Candolleomyces aberdarensis]